MAGMVWTGSSVRFWAKAVPVAQAVAAAKAQRVQRIEVLMGYSLSVGIDFGCVGARVAA
ncbi:hypothetical protein GCM10007935_31260 [Hydrogenophaga electricum]|uniref:Uncharacterized protein n=1 Tax=Hydrogenophaga electricum TaxID=1230953 RepID=A0ABQ6C6U9_9BURK|nr:hypothetical protein GCM10007935_31260 [Hydrogenophaga electricum]